MRIVDLLVERTTCPPARAILAVAQSLQRGSHPACVELQAYYRSAYVWWNRASSVQNPGTFAAARLAQCMPAPAAAAANMVWEDHGRLEELKGELEEVKAAERRAAPALEEAGDGDNKAGTDGNTALGDGAERTVCRAADGRRSQTPHRQEVGNCSASLPAQAADSLALTLNCYRKSSASRRGPYMLLWQEQSERWS